MLNDMVDRWSEDINVLIASIPDTKYNECTYTTTTIRGRLVLTEEQILGKDGTIIISKAKLFTTDPNITINSKVDNFKVYSSKECKDNSGIIQFYKYILV